MASEDNKEEDSKTPEVSRYKKVVVCGGGNGAHAFVVTIASKFSPRFEVNWLSTYSDEAARYKAKIDENNGYLRGIFTQQQALINAKPNIVTKNPAEVLPDADIVILCVPAFGHSAYLKAINDHSKVCTGENTTKKLIIAAVPSSAGLEFVAKDTLNNFNNIILFNAATLPWACRVDPIENFGREVEIAGMKDEVDACISANGGKEELSLLQSLFLDNVPNLACDPETNILSSSLAYVNPVVHCPIMYKKWCNYNGEEFDKKPLFYIAITEEDAQFMIDLSKEVLLIGEKITEAAQAKNSEFRKIYVRSITDTYTNQYAAICKKSETLYDMFVTNPSYDGLYHPMKKSDKNPDKWVPDFKFRYLTEDIPYGLLIMKAVALLLDNTDGVEGVDTPVMDQILLWAEKVMNKQYFQVQYGSVNKIIGLNMESEDIKRTRVPQNHGFNTIDDIKDF